jgi:hypothetical protein
LTAAGADMSTNIALDTYIQCKTQEQAQVVSTTEEFKSSDEKGARVYETVTHSYSKKTEYDSNNNWRRWHGHIDHNGVFYGNTFDIECVLHSHPGMTLEWVDTSNGWSGRTTYEGNILTGVYHTTYNW